MQQRLRAAIGSLVFFGLAPGTVAGLVPYWLTDSWQSSAARWYLRVPGALLVGGGLLVLILSFARFVIDGLGTPAPVAPTKRLVVSGFYRYVRNPMYVAIAAIIVGQALWFARWGLLGYAAIAWATTALFVRFFEEPTLARTFGAEYDEYRRNVPARLPRRSAWNSLQ